MPLRWSGSSFRPTHPGPRSLRSGLIYYDHLGETPRRSIEPGLQVMEVQEDDDVIILNATAEDGVYPLGMVVASYETVEEEMDNLETLVRETTLEPPGGSTLPAECPGNSKNGARKKTQLKSIIVVPEKTDSASNKRTRQGESKTKTYRSSKVKDSRNWAKKSKGHGDRLVESNRRTTERTRKEAKGLSGSKRAKSPGSPRQEKDQRNLGSSEIERRILRNPPDLRIPKIKPVVQIPPLAPEPPPRWLPVPCEPIQHLPRSVLQGLPLGEINWSLPSTGKAAKQLQRVPFRKPIGPPELAEELEEERIAAYEESTQKKKKKKKKRSGRTQLHLDDYVSYADPAPAQTRAERGEDGTPSTGAEASQLELPMETESQETPPTSIAVPQFEIPRESRDQSSLEPATMTQDEVTAANGTRRSLPVLEAVSSLSFSARDLLISDPSPQNQRSIYSSITGTIPRTPRPGEVQRRDFQQETREFWNTSLQAPRGTTSQSQGQPRPPILRGKFLDGLKVIPTDHLDPLPGHCHNCHGPNHQASSCRRPKLWKWCENCARRGAHKEKCERCAEAAARLKASFQQRKKEARKHRRAHKQRTSPGAQPSTQPVGQGLSTTLAGRLGPPVAAPNGVAASTNLNTDMDVDLSVLSPAPTSTVVTPETSEIAVASAPPITTPSQPPEATSSTGSTVPASLQYMNRLLGALTHVPPETGGRPWKSGPDMNERR